MVQPQSGISPHNYHQLLRIITKSLLTLRGEWFIINSLYLHRAWEFYTNSTDWQTFTLMAWEQESPAIFDKLLKQFNVSIIHWRFAHSVWKQQNRSSPGQYFSIKLTPSSTKSFCDLPPSPSLTSSSRNHWNSTASQLDCPHYPASRHRAANLAR